MLKTLRPLLACHIQAALYSFNALCAKPLATFTTATIIGIVLTLPALLWVFTDNAKQLPINWQEGGHILLYLKKPLSAAEELSFLEEVKRQSGVALATLKTPAEGLEELQKQDGMQDIMRYLPDNPLPAVIEVFPDSTLIHTEEINHLFNQLKSLSKVDEIKLDKEWIVRLHAILAFFSSILKSLAALLLLAVILIIGNTLRLAIYKRHEEIQVLKLLGAADPYIIRPFLYAGIWYGLMGAVFAILFVTIFMVWFSRALEYLAQVYHMHYPFMGLSVKQAYIIMLSAIFLSWVSAKISVKLHLASIEPLD